MSTFDALTAAARRANAALDRMAQAISETLVVFNVRTLPTKRRMNLAWAVMYKREQASTRAMRRLRTAEARRPQLLHKGRKP